MAKNTKGKKQWNQWRRRCAASAASCVIFVIGIYLFVILAVLPLYNRGYAQIGTDKENFLLRL